MQEPRDRDDLPHGARGFEIGGVAIEACSDGKILIIPKDGGGTHYTLHPGGPTGTLDFHKAIIGKDGRKTYETMFKMRQEDIPRLLADIEKPLWKILAKLPKPLTIDWLHENRIAVLTGVLPTGEDLAKVTTKKRRRLEIDEKRYLAGITAPKFLEDILDLPINVFGLFDARSRPPRFIGYGLRIVATDGQPRLFWISMHAGRVLIERGMELLQSAASRYTLPLENGPT